jgi:hypothetical protein
MCLQLLSLVAAYEQRPFRDPAVKLWGAAAKYQVLQRSRGFIASPSTRYVWCSMAEAAALQRDL